MSPPPPPLKLPTTHPLPLVITPTALSPSSFAPFGSVAENPRLELTPQSIATTSTSLSPLSSISSSSSSISSTPILANHGTALKYAHVSTLVDLYAHAPSKVPSRPITSIFVCAERSPCPCPLPLPPPPATTTTPTATVTTTKVFPLHILERHPFTTQTFCPLGAPPGSRYLVVVAPSLARGGLDSIFAVPPSPAPSQLDTTTTTTNPPCRGLPDLYGIKAFIAHPGQAVTYGAGTWHAPMMVLPSSGGDGGTLDFLVTQFANGMAEEDCQEVEFEQGQLGVDATMVDVVGESIQQRTSSRL